MECFKHQVKVNAEGNIARLDFDPTNTDCFYCVFLERLVARITRRFPGLRE